MIQNFIPILKSHYRWKRHLMCSISLILSAIWFVPILSFLATDGEVIESVPCEAFFLQVLPSLIPDVFHSNTCFKSHLYSPPDGFMAKLFPNLILILPRWFTSYFCSLLQPRKPGNCHFLGNHVFINIPLAPEYHE